jgi:PAS domain S-box-containing protein
VLSEVFERMEDAFYSLDDEWRFTYVNSRAERLLQRPASELIGRTVWEAFPAVVGSAFEERLRRSFNRQEPLTFDEYYAPLDMWAVLHVFPSPTGLSVFTSNITSLRRTEAALGRSEGQLRALIDNSPSAIHMKDLDGRFVRVNPAFAAIFGLPEQALVGRLDRELLPPEAADVLERNDRRTIEEGHALQFEELVTLPSGDRRTYLTTKFPLRDVSGRVYGTAGISTDISDRTRAERALAESEQRFRKIFDEGTVGIVLLDTKDFRIIQANDRYAAMLGYGRDELPWLTLTDVTYEEDLDASVDSARRAVAGEIPYYRLDKRYVRRDGSVFWVTVSGSILRDESGKPAFILAMVEDISERKHAEEVLREQDLAIRRAYSDVIAAVTGGKLVLMTAKEMDAVLGEVVAEWAVDEYAALSDLRHELSDTLQAQGLQQEARELYVLATGEAVTNAIKHGTGGMVRVRRTPETLQTEVTDHGPGIDFEDLPKATLVPGFSTQQTLGMGFTIMLEASDRVLLATAKGRTTVVLEHHVA